MAKYDELMAMQTKAKGGTEADVVKAQVKGAAKTGGLTDMKITKAEQKAKDKANKSEPCCGSNDRYPYGLEIRLDDDAMKKLGIDLPEVGTEVTVTAKASVESAESRETVDGGARLSCTLQITKLKVG